MTMPPRVAFSTLAFPDATLASAASLGRSWGYSGIELRLIDGELIDPAMPAADRTQVKRTVTASGLPVVAVDSSIRLTDDDPGPELARFLELASDWEAPLVRVFGGALAAAQTDRQKQLRAAARVLESSVPLAERLGVAIGVETHDAFSASSVVAELLVLWTRRRWKPARWAWCGTAIIRTGWARRRPRCTPISAPGSCSRRSKLLPRNTLTWRWSSSESYTGGFPRVGTPTFLLLPRRTAPWQPVSLRERRSRFWLLICLK